MQVTTSPYRRIGTLRTRVSAVRCSPPLPGDHFSEQIAHALDRFEGGVVVGEICRQFGITEITF